MTQRFIRCLNRNKRSPLGFEALEDRQLLNAGHLLADLPLSAPPLFSSPIPVVAVALGREAGLSLTADVELDLEDVDLSAAAGAHINLGDGTGLLGGDASLHLDVNVDHERGLLPEVDLGLSGGAAIDPGGGGDAGLLLIINAGIGLGGAGPTMNGGPVVNDRLPTSLSFGNPHFFHLLDATSGGDGDQVDAAGPDDPAYLGDEGLPEQDAALLLAGLLFESEDLGTVEEPLGAASPPVPLAAGVVPAISASADEAPPEGIDLPPEEVGLLFDGALVDILSVEQALQQFLDWLGGLGEELNGWWAGLGIPSWVFLALVAAAAAGEVARRNLRQLKHNRMWDAAFALIGQP